jgi:hypothetical protein
VTLVVDDGNPCTADACSASVGATHTAAVDGTACGQGLACTDGTCLTNNHPPKITTTAVNHYVPGAATTPLQPLDVSHWVPIQYNFAFQGPANWVVAADKNSVNQTNNADPSIFLSDITLTDDHIEGTWRVGDFFDDDFIGIVFGYQDDRHFYLFDWKGNSARTSPVSPTAA